METPRNRPWWRYLRLSVRGLILVVLAVGGCLGWWLERALVQRKAVKAIRAAGGWTTYEWDVPGAPRTPGWRRWVAEHVGVDLTSNVIQVSLRPSCGDSELALVALFDRLESLDVGGANVTVAGMASLRRLTRLRSLYLEDSPITDAALVHLEALTGLERLSLNRTPVTDAGLVHLKGMARLRMLELASTQVGDAGMASLGGLPRLGSLWLQRTKVGDAGLAHLSRLPRLVQLELDSTWVTDAGLAHVGRMTNLRVLNLSHTQVKGPGLAHLRSLVGLTSLYLTRAPVTDDGLAHLPRLTGLSSLYVGKTRITDAGLAHLAGLIGLKELYIDGTNVSDAGLRHLEGLPRLSQVVSHHTRVTDAGKSRILKALPNLNICISSPDEADAAAKAEKPAEAGRDGGVGSERRLFTPDGKLVYVNVYSTAPGADRNDVVKFANDVVMPRLGRIKGFDLPRELANRHPALRVRLNPDQMRAHNLSSEDIIEELDVPSSGEVHPGDELDEAMGKVYSGQVFPLKAYELIVIWPSKQMENYAFIPVTSSPDGKLVQLKDVGRAELAPPFLDISSDVDGHPATSIVLKSLPGWSAAIAIEAIEKDLEELKAAAFPPGMSVEVIPLDSRDIIYAVIESPPRSKLESTSARCRELGSIARGIDGITSVSSLTGYQIRTEGHGLAVGTCLIRLKDRSGRKLTSRQIIETLEEKSRTLRAHLEFFEPPAVSVFVAAGGFSVRVLDRTHSHGDGRPAGSGAETFMDDLLKRKSLEGLLNYLAGHYPRHELTINNDVARQRGVSIADALESLVVMMGDDVQADGTFERVVEDYWNRFAKNGRGEMVPYRSFLLLRMKQRLKESDR